MLKKFYNLKKKKSITEYLKQKGNKKIIDTYIATKKSISLKTKACFSLNKMVKYSSLHDERKDILKTTRSSVILGMRASVFNMRKRFETLAAECFKDHRELSKFVLCITTTPALITITDKTCYVKLKRLETPVYQHLAEKLIARLNEFGAVTLDGTNRKIIYQF